LAVILDKTAYKKELAEPGEDHSTGSANFRFMTKASRNNFSSATKDRIEKNAKKGTG
jgi:hypothetical protein